MITFNRQMTVRELITALEQQPLDAPVNFLFDHWCIANIRAVWTAKNGEVTVSDGDVVTDDKLRPVDAPSKSENQYWSLFLIQWIDLVLDN